MKRKRSKTLAPNLWHQSPTNTRTCLLMRKCADAEWESGNLAFKNGTPLCSPGAPFETAVSRTREANRNSPAHAMSAQATPREAERPAAPSAKTTPRDPPPADAALEEAVAAAVASEQAAETVPAAAPATASARGTPRDPVEPPAPASARRTPRPAEIDTMPNEAVSDEATASEAAPVTSETSADAALPVAEADASVDSAAASAAPIPSDDPTAASVAAATDAPLPCDPSADAAAAASEEAPPPEPLEPVIPPYTYDMASHAELVRAPLDFSLPNVPYVQLHASIGINSSRRNNMHYLSDTELIYAVGNTLVVLDTTTLEKRTMFGIGRGGIGAICVHPTREVFAVAEKGRNPSIFIYSYPAMTVFRILRRGTERAFADLEFDKSGEMLASVGAAPDYLLTIWKWRDEATVLHTKAFSQEVFRVSFSPHFEGRLCTSGMGHIRFWRMAETFTGARATDFTFIYHFKIVNGSRYSGVMFHIYWMGF